MSLLSATILRPRIDVARLRVLITKRLYDTVPPGYEVNADAEPLAKYRLGGYHPIHIGAQFKYGQYRVKHKLGWGGEGTVWLARDTQQSKLVALKVLVADESGRNEESALLKWLSNETEGADHPGINHLVQLLDAFWHTGPNGTHECLVIDIAGRNAQDQAQQYPMDRLPALAAWSIARQITLALDQLHILGIAHADLHTRNIMLSPTFKHYTSPDLLPSLPRPYTAAVNALPPNELTQFMPRYLVEATSLPYDETDPSLWHAQLVDFGQSFHKSSVPKLSRTPLVLRAPELILRKTWDFRIDIWSLACTIFELVTGRPPFDPVGADSNRLVQEWTDLFGDLPEGWRSPWGYSAQWGDDEQVGITEWLKQSYFERADEILDGTTDEKATFSELDLDRLGDLLEQMFRYRPEERLTTKEILSHSWFTENSFV